MVNNNNNNNKIIYSFKRKGDISLIRRFKMPHKDEINFKKKTKVKNDKITKNKVN